jgi:pre-rRNA-processing protein IPI3
MDATERVFFAASPNGQVHQVNLFRRRTDKFGQRNEIPEAVGGGGQGSAEMIALEEDAEKKRLISVGYSFIPKFLHSLP